jgi:hypothetical protein
MTAASGAGSAAYDDVRLGSQDAAVGYGYWKAQRVSLGGSPGVAPDDLRGVAEGAQKGAAHPFAVRESVCCATVSMEGKGL